MFEQLKKLWGQGNALKTPDAALPAIDVSQLRDAEPDAETEELHVLIRQAQAAMEAVEKGCESVSGELPDSPDANDDGGSSESAESLADSFPATLSTSPRVTSQQILEAALFVGGTELTLKRLCTLLHNEFTSDQVQLFVEKLNQRYADEDRPYEIGFGEGGYRMTLKPEFDDVRNRVFGLGPKDVKLSQDALQVLSLVAYQQPIAGDRVAELRGSNATGTLRQLLRRQLIALDRPHDDSKQVCYTTTPRPQALRSPPRTLTSPGDRWHISPRSRASRPRPRHSLSA